MSPADYWASWEQTRAELREQERKELIIFAIVFLIILLPFGWLFDVAIENDRRCREAGGVVTRSGCLDSDVFINLNEETRNG